MKPATAAARLEELRGFPEQDEDRVGRLNALRREILVLLDEDDPTRERYGAAAESSDAALCCPVDYEPGDLAHIPREILDLDFGCGDPTGYARKGQTVLDLGSGSGKHVFMIAKKVGEQGRVIGVDKTPPMLARARAAVPEVMANLGYARPNVEFRYGHIENLRVDLDVLLPALDEIAPRDYDGLERLERHLADHVLIRDESVDLVVSNCVLNLVDDARKKQLLAEIFRVVKRGGSVAISDIVSDRPVPPELKTDRRLWSGCLAGAFHWPDFTRAFGEAGFHGMCEVASTFWKRVGDINFHSVTVRAFKGKQGPCHETWRSALYRGPFLRVSDDDGHVFERGRWTRVCEKTAELLSRPPYEASFAVTPALEDPAKEIPFECSGTGEGAGVLPSDVRERYHRLLDAGECCNEEGCC